MSFQSTNILAILAAVYPVGCIYISTNSTNPATSLGFGTWSAFGAGRVPVGFDSGQTEFDTDEETGGAKTHTHNLSSAGYAKVAPNTIGANSNVLYDLNTGTTFTATHRTTTNVTSQVNTGTSAGVTNLGGATDSGSTLPPYITVRMWKRTA